ncbi:hypothetical protein H261_20532 [Paramagnetospirillum caucaseum]|uniref:Uncharacterized protein n=1 Tax=Paramagnetospirillum caucaseum TaxID=1244869 RepID=M2Z198_9PROT|nr:hypothetical protein [Paramagnetospirillum caucaseum]EME68040.1 hypothetical protein H261_20532 [Paramagnetospirillum caucaseum]
MPLFFDDEIERLRVALEAEIAGICFDWNEGAQTALRLAELYPDIAISMYQAASRMMARQSSNFTDPGYSTGRTTR